jgi:hypothetical protein
MGLTISMGNGVATAAAGPQRGSAVTLEDGSYELLADSPGTAHASVATLDGSLTVGSRQVEIPDVESYVLDLSFTGQTVTGIVLDGETDRPLPQVYVVASPKKKTPAEETPGGGGSAQTRADGRFQLELTPGEYRLDGRADGYASDHVDVTVGSSGASDVRLTLIHGESIKGRVVDSNRRPVAGARVSARPAKEDASGWGFAQTLPDGSFEMFSLQAMPYTLAATTEGGGFAVRSGVSPGDADVVLALRPGGTLQLRVLGADGTPVEGAHAAVDKIGGVSVPIGHFGTSDARGVLELGVPAGSIEVRASKGKVAGRLLLSVPEGGTVTGEVRLTEPAVQ